MGRSYFESASQTATRTKVAQGTDGSPLYVKNKAGNFIIAHSNSATVISLKAFLSSYSIDIEYGVDEDEDGKRTRVKEFTPTKGPVFSYSVGLQLVAHSLTEAKLNLARINEINKMMRQTADVASMKTGADSLLKKRVADTFIVLYSNLISGNYKKQINFVNHQELLEYGLPGYIDNFDFKINKEIGMFEENGRLYPKLIDFSFNLKVSFIAWQVNNLKAFGDNGVAKPYLMFPYKSTGDLWETDETVVNGAVTTAVSPVSITYRADVGRFPFGLSLHDNPVSKYEPKGVGRDGSIDYTNNTNSRIYICASRVQNLFVSFKPFLESFDIKLNYPNLSTEAVSNQFYGAVRTGVEGLTVDSQYTFSFNLVAHSVEEARTNMLKVQSLIRLITTFAPDDDNISSTITADSLDPDTGVAVNLRSPFNIQIIPNSTQESHIIYIKFSNLISKKNGYITNRDDIVEQGLPFYVTSLNVDVDEAVGMFENKGLFYFKIIKLSLTATLQYSSAYPYDLDPKEINMWKRARKTNKDGDEISGTDIKQKPDLKNNFERELFTDSDFEDVILTYEKGKIP